MIDLYSDNGFPNRIDRKHITNSDLLYTGLHACKHSNYKDMIVVLYASYIKPFKGDEKCSPASKPTTSKCVKPRSVGQCGKCRTMDQCQNGYCDPFMKKCVTSGSDSC